MKHVLVVNQFALPRSQGGMTRHVDLFSRLEGWKTTFVAGSRNYTTQRKYKAQEPNFLQVPVPAYEGESAKRIIGWGLFTVQSAGVGLLKQRPDVVYASTPHLLTPLAGWVVAKLRRTKLVVEVRDLWPKSLVAAGALEAGSTVHRILTGLERWIYQQADQIVVVTNGWAEHFAELGIDADKLTVVANGTEPADFDVDDDRESLRQEFGFTRLTAIYAGAHGPTNGLDQLVEAARDVPDVDVVLVGSGTDKPRLQELAKGVPNVRFLDAVPKPELARLFKAADIGVHCVRPLAVLDRGMSPNKIYDYMAATLPVISNAGEGVKPIMADGECGRTGRADQLAQLISGVRDAGPEALERWGRAGRERIERFHSRRAAAQTLESVLDRASGK